MLYLFGDESGNLGLPHGDGNSEDFAICLLECHENDIGKVSDKIDALRKSVGKKEIKFNKLSGKDRYKVFKELRKINLKFTTIYTKKPIFFNSLDFFAANITEIIIVAEAKFPDNSKKIKVVYDGIENSRIRKVIETCLKKTLTKFSLSFGNSEKIPLLQAADFYAGLSRYLKKNVSSNDDISLDE
jgi:hypothetical protein